MEKFKKAVELDTSSNVEEQSKKKSIWESFNLSLIT